MQKQDKEALISTLYQEIGQIKAELAQQKKFNVPLVVLSTISTGIVVPIIVWAIENFLSKQTWPLVIHISNGVDSSLVIYLLIISVCAYLFIWWVMYRITHPFLCSCGYTNRFTGKFKHHFNNHVAQKKKTQY